MPKTHLFRWSDVLRVIRGTLDNPITQNDYNYLTECVDVLGNYLDKLDFEQTEEIDESNEEYVIVPVKELEEIKKQITSNTIYLGETIINESKTIQALIITRTGTEDRTIVDYYQAIVQILSALASQIRFISENTLPGGPDVTNDILGILKMLLKILK